MTKRFLDFETKTLAGIHTRTHIMRWDCELDDDLEAILPQFVFVGNVCILTCINTTTCVCKMFLVRFGSKKPEGDTMQRLSVLLGFSFRIVCLYSVLKYTIDDFP